MESLCCTTNDIVNGWILHARKMKQNSLQMSLAT